MTRRAHTVLRFLLGVHWVEITAIGGGWRWQYRHRILAHPIPAAVVAVAAGVSVQGLHYKVIPKARYQLLLEPAGVRDESATRAYFQSLNRMGVLKQTG